MNQKEVWHIIVAAGSGARFGSKLAKQWHLLDGKPVLMHTIERFRTATPEANIIIVLNRNDLDFWQSLCEKYNFVSPAIVFGGASRWESVRNAVEMVPLSNSSFITVHDGARPLVPGIVIKNVLRALEEGCDGAIPSIPVTDSLRTINETGESSPVDRNKFVSVQTPQGFKASLLKKAYLLPFDSIFTDDASVMSAAGFSNIELVEGSSLNIKITHPFDLLTAELILSHKWTD